MILHDKNDNKLRKRSGLVRTCSSVFPGRPAVQSWSLHSRGDIAENDDDVDGFGQCGCCDEGQEGHHVGVADHQENLIFYWDEKKLHAMNNSI